MQTLDLFHDGAMLSKGAQGVIQGYVGITGFDLGLGFGDLGLAIASGKSLEALYHSSSCRPSSYHGKLVWRHLRTYGYM